MEKIIKNITLSKEGVVVGLVGPGWKNNFWETTVDYFTLNNISIK